VFQNAEAFDAAAIKAAARKESAVRLIDLLPVSSPNTSFVFANILFKPPGQRCH
jgi:hypothetical protein